MSAPVPQAAVDAAMKAMGCKPGPLDVAPGFPPYRLCLSSAHVQSLHSGQVCEFANGVAAAVVAAVQWPIKAEALREAADVIERQPCIRETTCHRSDAIALRDLAHAADRIEKGE